MQRLYVEQYRLIQTLCGGTGVTNVTDITDITDIMDVTDVAVITDVTDIMDVAGVMDVVGGTVQHMGYADCKQGWHIG